MLTQTTEAKINIGQVEIDSLIQLPDSKIKTKVPFVFKGRNGFTDQIKLNIVPSCGCTDTQPQIYVEPGADFEIHGMYSGSVVPTGYSKSISVGVYIPKTNISVGTTKIIFKGKIV